MGDNERQSLEDRLRLAGLRPTRQRVAIARLLLDGRHRHVSAESLSAEIRSPERKWQMVPSTTR